MLRLLNTSLFLGILLIVVILAGSILKYFSLKIDPNENKLTDALGLKNNSYDGLFLGNSTAFYAFNPQVIDSINQKTSTYNLAVGGATLTSSYILLHDYMMENKKPSFVVLGLYINMKEWADGLRPTIFKSINDSTKNVYLDYLRKHEIPRDWRQELYSSFNIYHFRKVIDRLIKITLASNNYYFKLNSGQILSNKVNKVINIHQEHDAGINKKALVAFLDFCKKNQIFVFLVEPPNHKAYNESTVNRRRTLEVVNQLLDENVRFISMNTPELYDQNADWHSLNHLNKYGAKKFSVNFGIELASQLSKISD